VTRSWPAGLPAAANPEPAHTEPRPGNRNRFWRTTGIVLLAALVGAAAASGAWLIFDDEPGDGSAVTVVERVATEILSPEESGSIAASVARRVLPSIVTVQVSTSDVGTFVPEGSGSGVVLTTDGLLATNQHVVDGAIQVRVVFADGRSYGAEIVGTDALTDLAVLRIEAAGLTAVELGSMDSMSIGDTAIAVGSPLGLDGGPSVTVGVISAFDRRVQTSIDEQLYGMLQTDAPITRGSSGGALVDDRGRLIGITTAIGVSDVGAEGLGFAIPIDLVTRITDDLIDFGEARHAFLGVTGSTFFTQAEDGATIPAGVEVASVFDGTAAALAGVQVGDVIRLVDGEAVTTMEQLVTTIRLFRVDESIDLVILRDGTEQTISVSLMERPEDV
jgi:putative serine protease PepD